MCHRWTPAGFYKQNKIKDTALVSDYQWSLLFSFILLLATGHQQNKSAISPVYRQARPGNPPILKHLHVHHSHHNCHALYLEGINFMFKVLFVVNWISNHLNLAFRSNVTKSQQIHPRTIWPLLQLKHDGRNGWMAICSPGRSSARITFAMGSSRMGQVCV